MKYRRPAANAYRVARTPRRSPPARELAFWRASCSSLWPLRHTWRRNTLRVGLAAARGYRDLMKQRNHR